MWRNANKQSWAYATTFATIWHHFKAKFVAINSVTNIFRVAYSLRLDIVTLQTS